MKNKTNPAEGSELQLHKHWISASTSAQFYQTGFRREEHLMHVMSPADVRPSEDASRSRMRPQFYRMVQLWHDVRIILNSVKDVM